MKAKKHLQRVSELPCVVCGAIGVQAHHIRGHGITGGAQKASDWFSIPLCQRDHADLHAGIKTWEMRYGSQMEHVARTLAKLYA